MTPIILKGKKIWSYVRCSTNAQEIARQKGSIEEFVKKHGGFLLNEVEDYFSTRKSYEKRPGFEKVLKAISNKEFDVLVVSELDRLARNKIEHHIISALFKDHGITLYCANGEQPDDTTSESRFLTNIVQTLSEIETARMAERIKGALDQKVAKGEWRGGNTIPFGYRYCTQHKQIYIVKEEVEYVTKVFAMFLEKYKVGTPPGYTTIAKILNNNGEIRPGKENVWKNYHISRILKNPFYCGYGRYSKINEIGKKEIATYKCKDIIPIISEETFNKVQKLLKSAPQKKTPVTYNVDFLLKNLALCGYCGNPLQTKSYKEGDNIYSSYQCRYANSTGLCEGVSISKTIIEDAVWEQVKSFITSLDYNKILHHLFFNLESEITKVKNQIKTKELEKKKVNKLIDKFLDNIITTGMINSVEENELLEYKKQLKQIEKEVEELQFKVDALKSVYKEKQVLISYIKKVFKTENALDDKLKGAVIKGLVERVYVKKERKIGIILKESFNGEVGKLAN